MIEFQRNQWALILGGSSGFGLATAKKLSAHGMSVCIIHRDRQQVMDDIEREFDKIRAYNNGFLALNLNALTDDGRAAILDALTEEMGEHGRVRLLLHSIARGYLKLIAPLKPNEERQKTITKLATALGVAPDFLRTQIETSFNDGALFAHELIEAKYRADLLTDEELARTIYAMGTNQLSWVRDVHNRNLFCEDARVLGLTSEGNNLSWLGYAAVSAAKVALEAITRAIAVEFAPYGIRANVIQAGITDTPAMRAIPGSAQMKAVAQLRNPFNRLTEPEDVANFICLLCTDEAAWVNGAILRVDGGESIASR